MCGGGPSGPSKKERDRARQDQLKAEAAARKLQKKQAKQQMKMQRQSERQQWQMQQQMLAWQQQQAIMQIQQQERQFQQSNQMLSQDGSPPAWFQQWLSTQEQADGLQSLPDPRRAPVIAQSPTVER